MSRKVKAWQIDIRYFEEINEISKRLNFKRSVTVQLMLDFALLRQYDRFLREAALPGGEKPRWGRVAVRVTTESLAQLQRAHLALNPQKEQYESDIVRMVLGYIIDRHMEEFLQDLEENYEFEHIRRPVRK
jgi:hypothetical protein